MPTFLEKGDKLSDTLVWEAKRVMEERGRGELMQAGRNLAVFFDELPEIRNLALSKGDLERAVRVPLKGDGELRVWGRPYMGAPHIVVDMTYRDEKGDVQNDMVLVGTKDSFVIDQDNLKRSGVRFMCNFDPKRDFDTEQLDKNNPLQMKVAQAFGYKE